MEPTPFAEMFGETEDLFEARPPLLCFCAVLGACSHAVQARATVLCDGCGDRSDAGHTGVTGCLWSCSLLTRVSWRPQVGYRGPGRV